MRSLQISAALALALAASPACGLTSAALPLPSAKAATAAPTPSPSPTRDPSKDSEPLLADVHLSASGHSFEGGDDHVTLSVDNRGRDIQDLVIQSRQWVEEHGLAMGATASCLPNLAAGEIACGPIYSGQSAGINLRALPATAGTYHYVMRLYDREGGALVPITLPDGRPAEFPFVEVVDRVTTQIPTVVQAPSPSPSA